VSSKLKSALAIAILIFLIAAKIIGAKFPSARLWGINQLAFVPLPLAVALIAGICLVWIALWLSLKKSPAEQSQPKKLSNPNILYLIFGLAIFGILFYILRDRLNLLGDSYLRIEELQKKGLARLFADTPSEALDYFVHWITYAYVLKPLKISALVSYQIWSIIAGLIYTFVAWLIASKLRKYDIDRWLSFGWIMAWGGLMLFCGYAENYSLAAACLLITMSFAIDFIHSGKKFPAMLSAFVLAFFFHNLTVVILPALWYAVLIQSPPNRKKALLPLVIVTIVMSAYLIATRISSPEGTLILFDSISEPGYTLFSGAHLLDILNQLLLVSPAFLALLFFQNSRIHPKPEYRKLTVFFWIAAVSGLAALLFIDPKLGMARDWDLFALPLLAFHLAMFMNADWNQINKPIKIGMITIALGFTFIWILVNANQTWALERYQQIAGMDNIRGGYNYEVLGNYYYDRQNYAASEDAFAKSVARKPHPRCYIWLGYVQMSQNKYGPAEKNLLEALRLNPNSAEALDYLSRLYFQTNRLQLAKEYLDRYAQTPEGTRNPEVKPAQAYLDSLLIHQTK
jgi:hypothetical protein